MELPLRSGRCATCEDAPKLGEAENPANWLTAALSPKADPGYFVALVFVELCNPKLELFGTLPAFNGFPILFDERSVEDAGEWCGVNAAD